MCGNSHRNVGLYSSCPCSNHWNSFDLFFVTQASTNNTMPYQNRYVKIERREGRAGREVGVLKGLKSIKNVVNKINTFPLLMRMEGGESIKFPSPPPPPLFLPVLTLWSLNSCCFSHSDDFCTYVTAKYMQFDTFYDAKLPIFHIILLNAFKNSLLEGISEKNYFCIYVTRFASIFFHFLFCLFSNYQTHSLFIINKW